MAENLGSSETLHACQVRATLEALNSAGVTPFLTHSTLITVVTGRKDRKGLPEATTLVFDPQEGVWREAPTPTKVEWTADDKA